MRRRTRRPACQEAVEKRALVVLQWDRVDMNAVPGEAVKRWIRARLDGNTGDKAEGGAGEIWHSSRAVIDYREATCGKREVAQRCQAGMGRGEHVDARNLANLV